MLTTTKFYSLLGLTIILSITSTIIVSHLIRLNDYLDLTYMSIGLYTILSIGIYHISERAARMKNKNFFMQIVMINTMIKMFSSVALVVVYFTLVKPSTTKFIVPFLVVYILFTIFETYFMMKQSRNVNLK